MKKPFKSWFGGKGASGSVHKIINQIRPHDELLELCLGNGTLYVHIKPANKTYLNDIDSEVVAAWQNHISGNTYLSCSNVIDYLKAFKFNPKKRYVLYLDPPYPHSSRKSRTRYNFEMTDEEHRELIVIIKNLPANVDVLISTYENEIYQDGLKDWRLIKYWSKTRGGMAEEYLYMNYAEPTELHDYNYLGEDFIDRQRIKRKIDREIQKLISLPPTERNAIINAVRELSLN